MGPIPLIPEVIDMDVDLIRRRVLGGPGAHRVSGQVSIGRSEAVRLKPDSAGLDADLAQALMRGIDEYHYYLVLLSCTFRADSAPVVSARLSVALRQASVRDTAEPVVWSMDPLRASTAINHRRTLRINPSVKIVPEAVGIDGSVERGSEFTTNEHHIVAEGEGEGQVDWVFTATRTNDLVGIHHLSMVVRTSPRALCHADLALAAARREKRFGLVPYRAQVPPHLGTIRLYGP